MNNLYAFASPGHLPAPSSVEFFIVRLPLFTRLAVVLKIILRSWKTTVEFALRIKDAPDIVQLPVKVWLPEMFQPVVVLAHCSGELEIVPSCWSEEADTDIGAKTPIIGKAIIRTVIKRVLIEFIFFPPVSSY